MPLDETLAVDDPNHVAAHEALHIQHNLYEGTTPADFAASSHGTHVTDELDETAHDLLDHTGLTGVGGGGLLVVRTADLAVPTGVSHADITNLFLALEASTTYWIDLSLLFTAGTAGYRFGLVIPSGATIAALAYAHAAATHAAPALVTADDASYVGTNTVSSGGIGRIVGIVTTVGAGNLQARHAHSTGTVSTAVTKAGSSLKAQAV